MNPRTLLRAVLCALALSAVTAPSAGAIVGGKAVNSGYDSVALIRYGAAFQCTGTLIAPNWVLTAGHCDSLTGAVAATPVSWPAPLIDVRIGGYKYGEGERVAVKRVVMHPDYLFTMGYDVSLLELVTPSSKAPTQVSGAHETGLWSPGTLETIVGWGVTEEGGDVPDDLQAAQVPVTTDAYCADAYDTFESQTQICAGLPEGGVDSCQGDSGGPMFGRSSGGALRVVGTVSYGEGCARPGKPGVYGRVGDTTLREWIASHVPAGVASSTSTTTTKSKKGGRATRTR